MPDPDHFHLWIVDDSRANHDMIRASFTAAVQQYLSLSAFYDGQSCIDEILSLAAANAALPDFILLDFFLGDMVGSDVLEKILPAMASYPADERPVIIAHSSERRASERMVANGADFLLPKFKEGDTSPHLASAFDGVESMRSMRQHRRLCH